MPDIASACFTIFIACWGGDEEKAQDFLQDLFLKIVEKPARFKRGHAFASWLYTVAHNMCKNEYRKQSVRKIVVNDPDIDLHCGWFDGDHDIEKACDERAFLQALMDELDQLSVDQRTTFFTAASGVSQYSRD